MAKYYIVTLDSKEREMLHIMINAGTERARRLTHARILLKADEGWTDEDICRALDVGIATIERVRKRFVLEGLEAALSRRRPRREYSRKFDGEQEARLVAVTCSPPPGVSGRWSLRLLADRVVQLKIVDSVSHETSSAKRQRTQALAQGRVVHSPQSECPLCVPHGRCAECLQTASGS